MGIDKKELFLMNSPLKKLIQKYLEYNIFKYFLKRHKIDLTGKVILDAGCGAGYGLEIISKELKPAELVAFDLLPEEVAQAKRRKISAKIFVGDITNINLSSEKFDAVFTFTVLHHTPKWREGIKELHRVLKPGGVLLINEHNRSAIEKFERFFRVYHPKASRFDWSEFTEELKNAGFRIIEEKKLLGESGYFLCVKLKTKNKKDP